MHVSRECNKGNGVYLESATSEIASVYLEGATREVVCI